MKKLTLILCALTALVSAVFAGTETYSSKQVQTPCPQWYADNEWTAGISGIYATRANTEDRDFNGFNRFSLDAGLGNDVWGFGGDIKYFWHRYFGFGVQGFGLSLNREDVTINGRVVRSNDDTIWAGGALGTFTLRYPFQCSRFAPYAWWGFGGFWGQHDSIDFNAQGLPFRVSNDDARLMGQYGLGLEVRITPHIGWTFDGSYNQVEYAHNDFWMVRTGINFAF